MSIQWNERFAMDYPVRADGSVDYSVPPSVKRPDYAGKVLATFGRDERIMSDVYAWVSYAQVWNGERIVDISFTCSEFPTNNVVTVDASDDVKAAANRYLVAQETLKLTREREATVARAVERSKEILKGRHVTVIKGRKIPQGETGVVFWTQFGGRFGSRVGIQLDSTGERVFTAMSNVAVTNPAEHFVNPCVMSNEELIALAERSAPKF